MTSTSRWVRATGSRASRSKPAEHVEHLRQEHAPGRRRCGTHQPPAAVVGRDGRALDHAILGEVLGGPDAARGLHPDHQGLGHGTGVETGLALAGQCLQGVGQCRLADLVALGRGLSVDQELGRGGRGAAQGRRAPGGQAAVVRVRREAVPGQPNGGGQARGQRQPAVVACQMGQGGGCARDPCRQGAVQGQFRDQPALGVQVQVAVGAQWGPLSPVEHDLEPVAGPMQQPEAAAPQAGTVGLDHPEGGADGDGCIEGVAAGGQDLEAGGGGQGVGGGDGRCGRRRARGGGGLGLGLGPGREQQQGRCGPPDDGRTAPSGDRLGTQGSWG